MFSPGINLVMTVIGFAVSTMFIVFVCTRLICARIQLSASRRSFPTASRSDLSVLDRGLHGLEPVVVSSFPTKKFSDHCFASGQDTQCTICLAEYQEKDMLRVLPYCGHAFHLACIDIWLKQHSTCPMCRVSLRDSPERRRALMQPAYSSAVRSVYTMESFSMDPYQSVHGGNVYSNADGAADNHTVESNLSARPGSEGSSVRETGSTAIDCSPKTEGKYMDSPSNS